MRSAAVNPPQTAFEGGHVTITAEATDEDGDALTVQAEVKKPDGTTQTVALTKGAGPLYNGAYTAPGNPTRGVQTHEVRVTAHDGKADPVESNPVRLTVNPAGAPPGKVRF